MKHQRGRLERGQKVPPKGQRRPNSPGYWECELTNRPDQLLYEGKIEWAGGALRQFGPFHSCQGRKYIIEGSLEAKLPTIWRDEKAVSREKSQKRKDQKKEDAGARKGRKVAKHCVFSWFCGSGGLKSRLAKAAGAETSGEMRDEKLHAVVARSTFGSKMC